MKGCKLAHRQRSCSAACINGYGRICVVGVGNSSGVERIAIRACIACRAFANAAVADAAVVAGYRCTRVGSDHCFTLCAGIARGAFANAVITGAAIVAGNAFARALGFGA